MGNAHRNRFLERIFIPQKSPIHQNCDPIQLRLVPFNPLNIKS